jgi:histidine triad (HIT) family protein
MSIFDKIISGEIPSYKIYEDEFIYSFLDSNPHNRGHILVIPKTSYETLSDIPDDLLTTLITAVKKLAINTKYVLSADGYNILMNNGEDAGQTILHAHFHIVPRFKGDRDIYSEYISLELEEPEFKSLQERLCIHSI